MYLILRCNPLNEFFAQTFFFLILGWVKWKSLVSELVSNKIIITIMNTVTSGCYVGKGNKISTYKILYIQLWSIDIMFLIYKLKDIDI